MENLQEFQFDTSKIGQKPKQLDFDSDYEEISGHKWKNRQRNGQVENQQAAQRQAQNNANQEDHAQQN